VIVPPKKSNVKDDQYAGAYVKDPIVGMHDWVVSYDVNSLYPSLIIHFNISPETMIEKNFKGKIKINDILSKNKESETYKCMEIAKEYNCSIAANGTMYSNEKQGFLPMLMDKMYKDRKEFKSKMIEAKKKLEEVNLEMKKRGLLV
jgi:DNA polymerase elongation subunit (family B)